jgi:hypothetical protein
MLIRLALMNKVNQVEPEYKLNSFLMGWPNGENFSCSM